jgi:hypothetical protein
VDFSTLQHDERTQAGDHAISEAEIGRPFPGTIEDQQLVLDEYGFGDHGTRAAGTRQSGDRHQQMQKKDGRSRTARSYQGRDTPKKRSRI